MTKEELIDKQEHEIDVCDSMLWGVNQTPLIFAFIEGKKTTLLLMLENIKHLE